MVVRAQRLPRRQDASLVVELSDGPELHAYVDGPTRVPILCADRAGADIVAAVFAAAMLVDAAAKYREALRGVAER